MTIIIFCHGLYPFLNKKFKYFSKTHFPFFKDSIQCKKRLECMSFFSSVWQQEQLEGLSARLLLLGTWKSRLDKVSTEIQGLSSTHCNFQGLSRPCIFILKFKDFQGLLRCVQTLFCLLQIILFQSAKKTSKDSKGTIQ